MGQGNRYSNTEITTSADKNEPSSGKTNGSGNY